jgi:hypothetical protein
MTRGRRGSDPGSKSESASMDSDGEGVEEVSPVRIDPRVQSEIGKQLRAIYDDVINEPVPAKFMELLEQLERSTTGKS